MHKPQELERLVEIAKVRSTETSNVIENKLGKFTKKEILEMYPSLSTSTVERHLKKLAVDGYITKHGADKNTHYTKREL